MDAVIFDIDGTLLQSAAVDDDLYNEAVRSVITDARIRPNLSDYDHVSDSGILSQILSESLIDEDDAVVAAIKQNFVGLLAEHVTTHGPFPEIPGAKTFLQSFVSSANHKVAIATGGWRPSALLKLESAGFADLNVPVATSDDAKDRKEIMQIALSHISGEYDSITYYGDGPWDRDASLALGWNFVAVGAKLGGLLSYEDLN